MAISSRESPATERRTTPALFIRQSVAELRKVVWPTRQQLATYWTVVLVFVLFMITVVSLIDIGVGWAFFKFFA